MKKYKILSAILAVCLIFSLIPAGTYAEEIKKTDENSDRYISLEDIIAGNASINDLYEKIDSSDIPDIIGIETAESRNHIRRLYSEEKDNLNTVIFENADGSKTMYLFDYPVKYVDASGNINDISLDIKSDNTGDGSYVTTSNSIKTEFSKSLADGVKLKYESTQINMVPLDIYDNSRAEFNADAKYVAYSYGKDTTLEYSLTYTGFKEEIVVGKYTGQTEYSFALYTDGLFLKETDGSYNLYDKDGQTKAYIGDVIVFTADEKNNTLGYMTCETVEDGSEYILTIHLDDEFLRDEKTIYPIRIDPSIEINGNSGSGAIEDVTINSLDGSSGSSWSLYVGKRSPYGVSRALMKFPGLNLSAISSASQITDATVEIRDLLCESAAMTVYCYVFSGNTWTESTANWSNVSPNSYSTYLSENTVSYANGTAQSTYHRYKFNITEAVRGWKVGNYNQSKGVIFKASSTIENAGTYINKTFSSYNRSSYQPSMSITYNTSSGQLVSDGMYYFNNRYAGKYLTYTSSAALTGASGLISNLGNTIRWSVKKVDDGYVIQPVNNNTKYLASSSNSSSSSVLLETITDSSIPSRCKWNITLASDGGCLVRNIFNSKYLYIDGSTMYVSSTTGTIGTSQYNSRVWRVASISYYGNTSSYQAREFSDNSSMSNVNINVGSKKTPIINKYYSNEIWCNAEDFIYTGYNTGIISIDSLSGKIIGKSDGSTTITATHKITGRVKSFISNINTTKIFQYYRLPGLNENGIDEAPDMMTNNKSRFELYNMSLLLGDLGILYDEDFPIQGPEKLYSNMYELAYIFTINDSSMTTVANEMIAHFLDGSGTPYSNTTLTNRAYNHLSTQNLISNTTSVINNYMQAYNGDIEAFYTSNVFYNDIQAVGRAHFNNPDDMWNGLKICINDTWGYYLTLEQCSISNNNYSMSIRYTIYDHFGLNDVDITGDNWYLGYTNQFGSWYVLQHYTGCNNQYRPFITYIEFINTISGTLS